MYLLKLLQHQIGLELIIVSRIVNALSAWGGFMCAELIGKVGAVFRRLKRFGYITDNLNVSDLIQNADEDLFL